MDNLRNGAIVVYHNGYGDRQEKREEKLDQYAARYYGHPGYWQECRVYQVKEIAQQAITYYQSDYQILAGVHEDQASLHIHFVMNATSYRDGSKYRGKKKDYYTFKRHLNNILRPYGTHVCLEK